MRKQMICLFLCLALLATLVSGCGSAGTNVPQQTQQINEGTSKVETTVTPTEEILASTPAETTAPVTEETIETTPAETTAPPEGTTAPTEKPSEQPTALAPWKIAYLDYIENLEDEKSACAFRLVHVDSDGIPELFISGSCEAAGSTICSYKNGQVIVEHLRRLHGAYYLPETGLVYNCNGNMGFYTTEIFRLSGSGFTLLFSASQEEAVREYEDENGNYQVELSYKYYLYDGDEKIEVTEEAFYAAQAEIFDIDTAQPLHPYDDSNIYSYGAIREHITNW